MITILLIDDEADARYTLRNLINQYCPDIDIVGEAAGVNVAFDLIHQLNPDALLLDIAMPDGTGFDLLDRFPNPFFKVVFTTAFDHFAIKAFRYYALDYLLKPVDVDEFLKTMQRLKESNQPGFNKKIAELLALSRSRQFKRVALSSMEGLVFLRLQEIVRLEGAGNYTTFFTADDERHVVVQSIKEYEELLPSTQFIRTHQSHIVNLNFIRKYLREDGGSLLLENGDFIPVARRRKDVLLETLREAAL